MFSFQALRHEMQRLSPGHKSVGSREKGEGQSFSSQLFHLPGLPKANEHGRGALRPRRQQIRLQGRLLIGKTVAARTSHAK